MQEESGAKLEITGINATGLPEVVVTANVLDNLGQPVSGLGVDEFSLFGELTDLGTITSVENITDDNLAFASVLVIDTSSSMDGSPILNAQEAARQYVNALGPDDPVSIITFDTTARVVLDYTTDKNLLIETINSLRYGGKTALYDAAVLAVEQAAAAPLPRRAAILLSDSAEYGGVSSAVRQDALELAQIRGVPPIYTIGLGFGTDRSYLQQLASGTNARYFESPTPDELVDIYSSLAATFRSQYVITLNVDVEPDGAEYLLELIAETEFGSTNEDSVVLRAPIIRPIISFADGLFAEPIAEPITVTPNIQADDEIESVEFVVADGEPIAGESVTIDPQEFAPGTYSLTVRATDSTGDVGEASVDFEIAALPSDVTLNWSPGDEPITEPQDITVDASGQTATESVTFTINDEVVVTSEEEPYGFTLDPADFAPGTYTLGVEVLNEGGVVTIVEQSYTIGALSPQVTIADLPENLVISEPVELTVTTGGQTPITDVTFDSGTGEPVPLEIAEDGTAVITIDPNELGDGTFTGILAVTNEGGVTEIIEIPFTVLLPTPTPTATFTPTNTPTLTGTATDEPSDTPTEESTDEPSDTPTEEPTDMPSDTPTEESTDTPSDTPTEEPTDEPSDTPTEEPSDTPTVTVDTAGTEVALADVQGTDDAVATLTSDAEAQMTSDAAGTLTADAEANAQLTADAEAQMTSDAAGTLTAEAEETEEATVEVTDEPTATETEVVVEETEAVITAEAASVDETDEAVPSLTPIGELTEVEGEQPIPNEANNIIPFIIVGLVILLFIIGLFMVSRRRNSEEQNQ